MITDLEMLRSLVRLRQAVMHGIEVLQSPSLHPNDKSLAPIAHPPFNFRVGDFLVQDQAMKAGEESDLSRFCQPQPVTASIQRQQQP